MIRPHFSNYNDEFILVKVNLTITRAEADAVSRQANEWNKQVIKKNIFVIFGERVKCFLLVLKLILF